MPVGVTKGVGDKKMKRWVVFTVPAVLAVLALAWGGSPWTPSAFADTSLSTGGMDLHLSRPAVDSRGHITVNGTDVLPHKKISFGLTLDAGFGILRYRGFETDSSRQVTADNRENRESRIVRQGITGTLHFNFGLLDRLVLGMQLPITVFRGEAVQVPGLYNDITPPDEAQGLSAQGIGDLSLHAKVRLLNAARHRGFGIAAILRAQFPTGDDKSFTGEPGVALWPSVVVEYRPIKKIRFSLEGGYRLVTGDGAEFAYNGRIIPTGVVEGDPPLAFAPTSAEDPVVTNAGTSFRYDDLITFGFGASFRIAKPIDLVMELYGTQIANEIGTKGTLSMEAMGGLKVFVQDRSYLVLAAGAGIPKTGFQAADIRATIGFIFEPSVGDRDGDGIPDDADGCPDDPEDFDGFEDRDGCPELDNDDDGIPDTEDACPLVPEDYDGDQDEDGCPEGTEGDRDGDGIADNIDKCPDEPEDFDGFEDTDGCPDPDNDRDGILDKKDLCPNEAEDKDGFEDEDGCPDLDNDQDRILDTDDSCPLKPETYNGFEDEDGCPDKGSVIVEDDRITILDKIYFDTGSTVIQERSYPILDAVAATLNGNPQITLIEIQGHADERGSDRNNIRLTRGRAASVKDAMMARGVGSDRVRSAGYGERCPVDPRSNKAAWEKNRRVEFKIIETEEGPTGVQVACSKGQSLIPR